MQIPNLKRLIYALADPSALLFRLALKTGNDGLLKRLVRHPVTFNENLRRKMVCDRDAQLIVFADKIESKAFISRVLGQGFVPETLQVGEKFNDLDLELLPREFALKVNHASGGIILVSDDVRDPDNIPEADSQLERLRLHSDSVDFARLEPLMNHWLTISYGEEKGEWAYSQVRPRLLVEEYLRHESQYPPPDYKFFVFNGHCHMVRVDQYRDNGKFRYHFTRNWEFQDITFAEFGAPLFPKDDAIPDRPGSYEEMLGIAERLAKDVDFLRVDLYEQQGRILVGELTIYPTSGTSRYSPRSYDRWLGSPWKQK